METIKKAGRTFVLVPREEWQKIAAGEVPMPDYPEPDAQGNFPAVAAIRVSIARTIIRDRAAIGWSQAELARQSGVNVETLNRIERARVSAEAKTVERLENALKRGAKALSKSKTAKPTRIRRSA